MSSTQPLALSFSQILNPYKDRVENALRGSMASFGIKTHLRDACEYALLGSGKRFRPALVLMIGDALNKQADVSKAALAVEFFHTASLIADDLPCMDNDDERRNKPTVHKVYGETVALLASYALIASGYECLAKNAIDLKKAKVSFAANCDQICTLALENSSYNTGLLGATGGQFLDVFPPDLSLPTLRDIIHKKTVSLFEIAFMLGWLYGGGNIDHCDEVKKAASHFGMAFQIADDFEDLAQDLKNGRKVNIPAVCGIPEAKKMFHGEISGYNAVLKQLHLDNSSLQQLGDLLASQVE
jgi:geranylgeranyl diphosphate synthase type II